MVPHGYLSDEEIMADEEDDDEVNPENQKKKLKILGEQFEAERNAKTKKLQPKVIGFVWLNEENDYPKTTPPNAVQFLIARHAWVREIPISLTAPADADSPDESGTPSSRHGGTSNLRKAQAVEEAMPDLIRLLHGNTHSRLFLVKEFLEFWGKKTEGEKPISKAKLSQKIKEVAAYISCPEAGPMKDKLCWDEMEISDSLFDQLSKSKSFLK
ncbi:hypothetical protein QAD02_005667 [Eretmocerus hayati]|uniref:Uncharacterized protein n=1 Tax=Eretmocerus hayati TaxID=131215 RepID=A0ACC2NT74_9HYME|nr:hypothetical protein QAD02_005667 [Eretmocerus hayati]